MNISQKDIKRIVLASRTMEAALNEAKACKETIDDIIKSIVKKDGKLTYMYYDIKKD